MSLDPTGEVRLNFPKMAAWRTQRACSGPQSRFDVPPVALLRGSGFLQDIIERILGLNPTLNGGCRLESNAETRRSGASGRH
jgi:hypothetical protein